MMAELCFITVCKGRLDHLKQVLPLLAAEAGTETVVVDYGCPQGTRHWIRENFPGVKIVAIDDDPGFCLTRGRNLGAAAATSARLCFIDADIQIQDGFVPWLLQNWQARHYFHAVHQRRDLWGTVACSAEDFSQIGGYDEAIRGWGGDDDDFYMRLEETGCWLSPIPATLLEPIRHDDAERMQFYEIKDLMTSLCLSQVYIAAKFDIARILGRALTLDERKQVYQQTQKGLVAIPAGAPQAVLEVTLPEDSRLTSIPGRALEKKLSYRILSRKE
jgi:glycosyltransferase involved in cell wall biosynthesis